MKRITSIVLALLIVFALPALADSVSVTDMKGRLVELDAPATRVVALTAADCEILFALGSGESVVGRGAYCDYPAEVYDIAAVQSGYETNIEQIIALKPRVLFMGIMDQTVEQVAALERAGIKVAASDANDIAGVYEEISMIGGIMGKKAEADALIESMRLTFAEVSEAASDSGKKTVYFEVSPLRYGLWTAGAGTFMNEIAEMLNLDNCFADVEGWAQISQEQVLARNPDYIVTISMYFGEGPTPEEEILARPGWENVTAVKNAAILNLRDSELSRPGPRLADGAKALCEFVYGR